MTSKRATRPLLVLLCLLALVSEATAQTAGPGRQPDLVGHWRNTRIVFESPRDDHLVLRADGLAGRWSVTASSRSGAIQGRWNTEGNVLSIDWEDGTRASGPFTFHEGELVFPNRQGQRRFWKRIQ
jgi:hypothetical protein